MALLKLFGIGSRFVRASGNFRPQFSRYRVLIRLRLPFAGRTEVVVFHAVGSGPPSPLTGRCTMVVLSSSVPPQQPTTMTNDASRPRFIGTLRRNLANSPPLLCSR